MKIQFPELADLVIVQGEGMTDILKSTINAHLAEFEEAFVQDISHISQAATYAGNMVVESLIHLKDNVYRCDYAYDWQIAWTCSGTQEAGRVKEKIRFTLGETGEIEFKFLKLEQ